jgi:hypothetical protein
LKKLSVAVASYIKEKEQRGVITSKSKRDYLAALAEFIFNVTGRKPPTLVGELSASVLTGVIV